MFFDYYERINSIEYNVLRTDVQIQSVKEREKFCTVVRAALEEMFPNADVLVTQTDDPERINIITDGTTAADLWVQEHGEKEIRTIGRAAWKHALEEDKKNVAADERLT
ncbi:hypothetical protein [Halodesulfovibrio marinisediminis]|uniref:Uncharacterized protein n=1 Tax=Halodesulfovibrio marinisediminis DSM 17456 TaxID=1121457 RepID=A0A1N6IH45_9BACT|nr:hypothetical protein [Halodesulfovibrio marinisediminis]SIO31285.1 hypothetical protein SAMN02745161_2747 [Halodesulfovibrio marinisediminis DSM 17456]